jgi:hypothetical protein
MGNRSQLATMLAVVFCLAVSSSDAAVVVSVIGNQATADISLSDGVNNYDAQVTITFDTPGNLTPAELNLSAELVDPASPSLLSRLPPCISPLLGCVTVDPAFPVLITVEPLDVPWLFASGFEVSDPTPGNLSFLNSYEFEVHTADLNYVDGSPYRLFKAPVNGAFDDITEDVLAGSVRARGRGGSFSQFLVPQDTRTSLVVELLKEINLQTRILGAVLDSVLQANLLSLLSAVQVAVTNLDYATAIADLDQLISTIQTHAGIDIANRWSSDQTAINDAGEMLSLAQTLRFTLVRLQNGQ